MVSSANRARKAIDRRRALLDQVGQVADCDLLVIGSGAAGLSAAATAA